MAKRKHKRPQTRQHLDKQLLSRQNVEKYEDTVYKLLHHFNFPPSMYDGLSKYSKRLLWRLTFAPPLIVKEDGHDVPRHIIKQIRTELYDYMQHTFFGDPANNLTYWNLALYGASFQMIMCAMKDQWGSYGKTGENNTVDILFEEFIDRMIFSPDGMKDVFAHMILLLMTYSQINYRYYGYSYHFGHGTISQNYCEPNRFVIAISSTKCRTQYFEHNSIRRIAYQVLLSDNAWYNYTDAFCDKKLLDPNDESGDWYKLFIQSHLIHRCKERIDVFDARSRNYIIKISIILEQEVVTFGNNQFFVCKWHGIHLGYFSFFIQDNSIVLSTFLPIIHKHTPCGSRFYALVPLEKEDIIFLGMDKISFYINVDFDRIPFLKNACIESGIWQIIEALWKTDEIQSSLEHDDEKTTFVKNYFDKNEENIKRRSMYLKKKRMDKPKISDISAVATSNCYPGKSPETLVQPGAPENNTELMVIPDDVPDENEENTIINPEPDAQEVAQNTPLGIKDRIKNVFKRVK